MASVQHQVLVLVVVMAVLGSERDKKYILLTEATYRIFEIGK